MDKLSKLLRKASDKAITPEEAALFVAKAKELAQHYQIDLAMVSLEDPGKKSTLGIKIECKSMKCRSASIQIYHEAIWEAFRQVFGVRTIYYSKKHPMFIFVGDAADILVCTELFPWLERLYFDTYYKRFKGGSAAVKRGCYYGITRGIVEANKKTELNTQEQQCWSLVVRKKEDLIEDEMKDVKKVKDRSHEIDPWAYAHGRAEGRKIKLDQVSAPTHNPSAQVK